MEHLVLFATIFDSHRMNKQYKIHIPEKNYFFLKTYLLNYPYMHKRYRSYGNQTGPIKWNAVFFQAAVVSILLYGCTTWTLTKWLEKKLDGNYTRMLWAILNMFWQQQPKRHQLYGHLPPIMKTIQVRQTRHAGHCWRSRDKLISDVLLWTPTYGWAKQDDQLEHTFSSYVRIRDIALKTCQRRWMIGRSGERVSGISMLAAQHDYDDDDV